MDLLTTAKREELAFIREPLTALLDDVARRMSFGSQAHEALSDIHREWLMAQESRQRLDWRYYLTRYPGARSSVGDGYFHNQDYDGSLGGFSYRHLRVLVGGDYTSHYRDALLRAAWIEGDLASSVDEPDWYWNQKETWIDPNDPGMRLKNSRAEIRCLETGFQIALPPERTDIRSTVASVLAGFPTDADGIVQVTQNLTSGRPVDSEDRIQLCIRLVKALVSAGL